jgi:hypothetical protein
MGKAAHQEFSQIIEGAPPARTALEGDRLVATTDFDFDAIDRNVFGESSEDKVDWKDMTSALAIVLGWICGRADVKRNGNQTSAIAYSGMRANALLYLLDPDQSRFESLQQIADASECTKAAVSKALAELRNQIGGVFYFKSSGSTENYQKAQRASIAAGVHSKFCRKDRKSERISLEAVAD